MSGPRGDPDAAFGPAAENEWASELERAAFGPLHRLRPPLRVGAAELRWERPAAALGSSPARW